MKMVTKNHGGCASLEESDWTFCSHGRFSAVVWLWSAAFAVGIDCGFELTRTSDVVVEHGYCFFYSDVKKDVIGGKEDTIGSCLTCGVSWSPPVFLHTAHTGLKVCASQAIGMYGVSYIMPCHMIQRMESHQDHLSMAMCVYSYLSNTMAVRHKLLQAPSSQR